LSVYAGARGVVGRAWAYDIYGPTLPDLDGKLEGMRMREAAIYGKPHSRLEHREQLKS